MAGKTHRRTWQRAEGRAAAPFGAKRSPGSGSSGRDDVLSTSDSTHERIYLETKLRAKTAVRALHDETKAKARKEGKVPVLALFDKGCQGCLYVVHWDDLEAFAAEVRSKGAGAILNAVGQAELDGDETA